jgi:hypothetical protein
LRCTCGANTNPSTVIGADASTALSQGRAPLSSQPSFERAEQNEPSNQTQLPSGTQTVGLLKQYALRNTPLVEVEPSKAVDHSFFTSGQAGPAHALPEHDRRRRLESRALITDALRRGSSSAIHITRRV